MWCHVVKDWGPAHTSCECEWGTNIDVRNSQQNSHWVEWCSTVLRISQRKRSCDVKFTSNLHRIRIRRKYEPGFTRCWGTLSSHCHSWAKSLFGSLKFFSQHMGPFGIMSHPKDEAIMVKHINRDSNFPVLRMVFSNFYIYTMEYLKSLLTGKLIGLPAPKCSTAIPL